MPFIHRRILQRLVIPCVAAGIAAAIIELVSAVTYSVVNGGLVYRKELSLRSSSGQPRVEPRTAPKTVLHPVLGFVNRPGISVEESIGSRRVALTGSRGDTGDWASTRANGDGFFTPADYPRRGTGENEFIVGVFGGSVAQWLAVQDGEYLASRIEQLDGFAGRRVRVLPFAQGGFKYPQQIQTLSYFSSIGQQFDVVIDISGFNEVALSSFNVAHGVQPGFPSFMHLGPLMQLIESRSVPLETIGLLARIRADTARATELEALSAETRVGSVWLFRFLRLRVVESRLRSAQEKLAGSISTASFEFTSVPRVDSNSTADDTCREAAAQWSRCSLMMHSLAQGLGAEFIEVLQPNQYFTNHEFSRSERSQAINPRSVFRTPVMVGYPFLRTAARRLREEGVHVIDAVDVFDSEGRPVFSDNCCHYNALGNRILVDRIFEELENLLTVPEQENPRR